MGANTGYNPFGVSSTVLAARHCAASVAYQSNQANQVGGRCGRANSSEVRGRSNKLNDIFVTSCTPQASYIVC